MARALPAGSCHRRLPLHYTALILGPKTGLCHNSNTCLPPEGPTIPKFDPRQSLTFLTPRLGTDSRADRLAGPIRGELLGAEHLAERAQEVAAGQRIAIERAVRRTPLLARLNDTRGILEDANRRLTATAGDADVGPAGE